MTVVGSRMTRLHADLEGRSDILNLAHGYPDGLVPAWLADLPRSLAAAGWRDLAVEPDLATLRRHFAAQFDGEAVTLTNSASEALLLAFDAALDADAGGEILTLDGTYDAYDGLARMCRGRLRRVPRAAPTDRPDVARLAAHVGPRTRALLLTQPENPLGWSYPQAELDAAAALARRHDLALILDCAFASLAPGGRVPLPAFTPDLRLLVIGDTGKLLDLHGVRLGAVVHAARLADRLRAAVSALHFRLDAPRIVTLARALADPRLELLRRDLAARVAANHRTLAAAAAPHVRCPRPEATSMALVSIPGSPLADAEFTAALLAEERVALVPLALFYADSPRQALPGACSARVALARPGACVAAAAARLARFARRRAVA